MPKHPEDGPISEKDAKAKAAAILADPGSRGQSAAHAASQKAERLDDPGHQADPKLDPAWKQNAAGEWVHDTEG